MKETQEARDIAIREIVNTALEYADEHGLDQGDAVVKGVINGYDKGFTAGAAHTAAEVAGKVAILRDRVHKELSAFRNSDPCVSKLQVIQMLDELFPDQHGGSTQEGEDEK